MEIKKSFISGLNLIHLNKSEDNRGNFLKVFNFDFFSESCLETNFKESFYSVSKKNVIRGMHFQISPAEHTKLVYVNHGAILDVVLDIRIKSPTYGQYLICELSSENHILIYIPVGCAHGFLSLEDNTMVTYLQTSCYNSEYDMGIKYNSFGMKWGINHPIVSDRDLNLPNFSETNFNF